jgi:hypothetical protein
MISEDAMVGMGGGAHSASFYAVISRKGLARAVNGRVGAAKTHKYTFFFVSFVGCQIRK